LVVSDPKIHPSVKIVLGLIVDFCTPGVTTVRCVDRRAIVCQLVVNLYLVHLPTPYSSRLHLLSSNLSTVLIRLLEAWIFRFDSQARDVHAVIGGEQVKL
jgi:hypothetical protein